MFNVSLVDGRMLLERTNAQGATASIHLPIDSVLTKEDIVKYTKKFDTWEIASIERDPKIFFDFLNSPEAL